MTVLCQARLHMSSRVGCKTLFQKSTNIKNKNKPNLDTTAHQHIHCRSWRGFPKELRLVLKEHILTLESVWPIFFHSAEAEAMLIYFV